MQQINNPDNIVKNYNYPQLDQSQQAFLQNQPNNQYLESQQNTICQQQINQQVQQMNDQQIQQQQSVHQQQTQFQNQSQNYNQNVFSNNEQNIGNFKNDQFSNQQPQQKRVQFQLSQQESDPLNVSSQNSQNIQQENKKFTLQKEILKVQNQEGEIVLVAPFKDQKQKKQKKDANILQQSYYRIDDIPEIPNSRKSQVLHCPHCQMAVQSIILYKVGTKTNLWAAGLFVLTVVGAAIPYLLKSTKEVYHKCSRCNAILGKAVIPKKQK
ncbi:hypothetical protein PPERSA_05940 [Pseudocohnilembus persalinus]|uniref:LITAF domain-containing protein n=1 Tax=Pseudocohnilembus persalinus TaxID=266149 RepID=A0A0V0R470_PSEPJ|nr:hypothetical protein PPERSA_05940 [Pseudocohnilembus persalinus]|eukprot:KRX09271.1 hypothetical protein PPERSA_05940 [Pseudocohnilembus persalinus]